MSSLNKKYLYSYQESGSVTILSTLLFLVISFSIITTVSGPSISNYRINKEVLRQSINNHLLDSVTEEFIYRVKNEWSLENKNYFILSGENFVVEIDDIENGSGENDVQKLLKVYLEEDDSRSFLVIMEKKNSENNNGENGEYFKWKIVSWTKVFK